MYREIAVALWKGIGILMEEFKVSIIVPVYNTEKYLKRCIDTLVKQIYQNLEIILVDDGSRDGSGKLCDEYALTDSRIRVIHKENGGLISSWKAGVQESIGEYLCFVDSDDWVDPQMISEMAGCLTGNKKEIISSDYVIEKVNGNRKNVYQGLKPGEYEGEKLKNKVIPELLGKENRPVFFSRCMKLISRELIIDNCKYSDPAIRMGEDVTVILPALIDCERLVIMDNKVYYHYFYGDASMAHGYDPGLYRNIRQLHEIIDRVINDKFSGTMQEEMQKGAQREYLLLLLLALKIEARGNPKGYRKNILEICRSEEIKRTVKSVDIEVSEKSNQLLYLVLRYPNHLTVSLLRAAMILYYRRR